MENASSPAFSPERLNDAVRARGLTWKALADIASIRKTTLSDYKNGYIAPSPDQLGKLAAALEFPEKYFYHGYFLGARFIGPRLFRASSALTQRAADQAETRLKWMSECLMYAEKFLHTPKPDFLEEFKSLHEPMSLEMRQIEAIALSVREKLGYSLKPINNLVRTLEKSGVAILRYSSLWKVRIDGLSQHSGMDRPLCAIFTSGETSAVRETFSLAHELGHIVLHSKINQRRFDELADGKLLEDQANRFAAAFLLPSTAFLADLITPAISYFEHLKKKWRVSIATMIRRCYDLGKISKEEYSSLNVRLSQKRWRKKEPLDDIFEAEKPVLIKQIFTTLVQRHGVKGCQIAEEMCLNPRDLSSISDLPANFFSDDDGQTNIIGFEVAAARA